MRQFWLLVQYRICTVWVLKIVMCCLIQFEIIFYLLSTKVFNFTKSKHIHVCADASVGIAYVSFHADGNPLQSKSYDLMLMP